MLRWQAAYGRPNTSTAPVAGWITLRQRSSTAASVPAVSNARFARARSTPGPALTISSIGRPLRRGRSFSGLAGGVRISRSLVPKGNVDAAVLDGLGRVGNLRQPASGHRSCASAGPASASATSEFRQLLRRKSCCRSFVDDRLDRPGTPPAFRVAAKTAVDLGHTRRNVRRVSRDYADVLVAQDIARANDHDSKVPPTQPIAA